jgi:hypothetical protein
MARSKTKGNKTYKVDQIGTQMKVQDLGQDENNTKCSECQGLEHEFMINCDTCGDWIHYECSELPSYMISQLVSVETNPFCCKTCTTDDPEITSHLKEVASSPKDSLASQLKSTTEELDNTKKELKEARETIDDLDRALNGHWTPVTSKANSEAENDENSNEILFKGPDDPLSNFFPFKLQIWGMNFRSTEEAYHYKHAIMQRRPDIAKKILDSKHAGHAKAISREILTDHASPWHRDKFRIMFELLRAKYDQCAEY